jgi:hypothetical protein
MTLVFEEMSSASPQSDFGAGLPDVGRTETVFRIHDCCASHLLQVEILCSLRISAAEQENRRLAVPV